MREQGVRRRAAHRRVRQQYHGREKAAAKPEAIEPPCPKRACNGGGRVATCGAGVPLRLLRPREGGEGAAGAGGGQMGAKGEQGAATARVRVGSGEGACKVSYTRHAAPARGSGDEAGFWQRRRRGVRRTAARRPAGPRRSPRARS